MCEAMNKADDKGGEKWRFYIKQTSHAVTSAQFEHNSIINFNKTPTLSMSITSAKLIL